MMKEEFAKILGVEPEEIPQAAYELVEFVYNWVPGLDKPLTAQMYKAMGLRAFKALKPWADEAAKAYDDIAKATAAKAAAEEKYRKSQEVKFL